MPGKTTVSNLVMCFALLSGSLSGQTIQDLNGNPAKSELGEPKVRDNLEAPVESEVKRKLDFKKNGGIVYRKTDTFELKCDVYVPEGEGPFPAILAVHGGAWRQGSKFVMMRHAWRMAQRGYVVVAINYRHAPKYPFPAQIHDCKHAVRWMRASAKQYKIDPKRIGGFGYSAGGHLVSMLGTTDPNAAMEGEIETGMEGISTRLCAVAAGGAPCEFSWISEDSVALRYWLGKTRSESPKRYEKASPTSYVSPDDPPFFLFHGQQDMIVPVSTTKTMQQLLQDVNVICQHSIAPRSGHIATFSDLTWMDKAIDFFDANMK